MARPPSMRATAARCVLRSVGASRPAAAMGPPMVAPLNAPYRCMPLPCLLAPLPRTPSVHPVPLSADPQPEPQWERAPEDGAPRPGQDSKPHEQGHQVGRRRPCPALHPPLLLPLAQLVFPAQAHSSLTWLVCHAMPSPLRAAAPTSCRSPPPASSSGTSHARPSAAMWSWS